MLFTSYEIIDKKCVSVLCNIRLGCNAFVNILWCVPNLIETSYKPNPSKEE